MEGKIKVALFIVGLYVVSIIGYAQAAESVAERVLVAANSKAKKSRKKKSSKKKRREKKGGDVLLDNPYGETSSEWATIDLYSKINLKGEHWVIDIYGTKMTIKNDKGEVKKKVKNNFFKSASIRMSSVGGVYFYDDPHYNRETEKMYGWAYLPSNDTTIEIKNFDKVNDIVGNIGKAYYRVKNKKEGKKLKGNISSIIVKFSKMK